MDEADVVARSAFANASRREAHALGFEPLVGRGQVVDPEADVVERGSADTGSCVRVKGLHQVDFHGMDTITQGQDVFPNVLARGLVLAGLGDAERVDPQRSQRVEAVPADGDLLETEDAKRASGVVVATHHFSSLISASTFVAASGTLVPGPKIAATPASSSAG